MLKKEDLFEDDFEENGLTSTDKEDKKEKNKKRAIRYVKLFFFLMIIGCIAFVIVSKRETIAKFLWPEIVPYVESDAVDTNSPGMNVEYITKKIEKISSLQTAKITYGCMVDFEEGSVKFINKKAFSMFYEATAYAGIEVSQILVTEENGKYIIQLPESRIEEKPKIDSSSFVFYDKESGLINKFDPEDVGKALEYAEKDVYYQATTDQLLDLADNNAISVIKNLLLGFMEENQFEIKAGVRTQDVKIKPPISSTEAINDYDGKKSNYNDLKSKFEEAGFKNIALYPIEDIKVGIFTKDGAVESITIDGKDSFKKSNIFSSNAKIVIKYHTKKSK